MAAFHEDAVAAGFGDSLSPTSALLSLLEAPTSLVEDPVTHLEEPFARISSV